MPLVDHDRAPVAAPPSFAGLARRLSAWTTNSLLTVLVLVAGLSFGRQVLHWWAADAPDAATLNGGDGVLDTLGAPDRRHDLQFGDLPWQLSRQSILGDRAMAVAALRAACRQSCSERPLPQDEAGPDEQRLLGLLSNREPVEQQAGQWKLFEYPGGLPMAALVAQLPVAIHPKASQSQAVERGNGSDEGPRVASTASRVVTWGLAFPTGQKAWTLYTLQPTAPSNQLAADLPEMGIPPGGRKILAVQVDGGGTLVVWKGTASADAWQAFFDAWCGQQGWTAVGDWRQFGPAWHRRYLGRAEQPWAAVEVHLRNDDQDRLTGLVMINRKLRQSEQP